MDKLAESREGRYQYPRIDEKTKMEDETKAPDQAMEGAKSERISVYLKEPCATGTKKPAGRKPYRFVLNNFS